MVSVADVTDEENFNFDVNAGARLYLENVNGAIRIEAWDGRNVAVRAIKTADTRDEVDRIEIKVDASADEIRIDTELPRSDRSFFNWGGSTTGEVSYEVQVPGDMVLELIETVNGSVRITGVSGDVTAETVNGDIEVTGLRGNSELETVNGSIEARFESFGSNQTGEFGTVNGSVEVILPANADARVSADTVNGAIRNDFGLEVKKGLVSRELEGTIGNGGGRLSFETVNGTIEIRSR
ncbi:MAG: hypothetical protein Tsb002_09250 [Wenzhouxiangellaceae bacterium]